jgi:hypothetical protein
MQSVNRMLEIKSTRLTNLPCVPNETRGDWFLPPGDAALSTSVHSLPYR